MGRRPLERATVELPDNPGEPALLREPSGESIELGSDAFAAWLMDLRPFALPCSFGQALVIPERRSRSSGRYWVARAYLAGRRESAYVGQHPDETSLRAARAHLEQAMSGSPAEPAARTASPALLSFLLAAAERISGAESDPARRAVAEELAGLARRLNEPVAK